MTAPDPAACLAAILRHDPALRGQAVVIRESWDSTAFDIGDAWIFKFPRSEKAAVSLRREAGLLAFLQGRLTLPVPRMTLHDEGMLFSRHRKLPGETVPPEAYARLDDAQRGRLAQDMARFYAELHALPVAGPVAAGALPVAPVGAPEALLALQALPARLIPQARAALAAYGALGPDPLGPVYGFFDGHGWNLAFDPRRGRLTGMFDFADSGIGPVHQEFVTPSFVAADLTQRIVPAYEALTGRALSRQRIATLTTVLRLTELGQSLGDPARRPQMLAQAVAWLDSQAG